MGKVFGKGTMIQMFKDMFAGVLGGMSAMIVIGLISVIFFGTGYHLVKENNKEGTKPFEDIQQGQYLGILLCIIGALPWIQYFFMGFLGEAGGAAFGGLFGDD